MTDLILPIDAFIRGMGVERQIPHTFFLGAGSSISSGIPSAGLCIWEWKRNIFLSNNPGIEKQFSELTLRSNQERIQRWFDTKGGYPINGSTEEYAFYIEKCYPIAQHRRQFFTEKIRNAQPHIGNKLLCLMAEAGFISSIWTTNFDGLVAKAATNYNITPIEIGIDCQQRVIRQPYPGELLCVSLHGDYRYDLLKNTDQELRRQEEELKNALLKELESKTLIIMGYSGRDESVMKVLHEAYSRPGVTGLYWCGFGDEINDSVRSLLETARVNGRTAFFIPTLGFDDSLVRLVQHCLKDEQYKKAQDLLSQISPELRQRSTPFSIEQTACSALIKSNIFEIDCPSEAFTFTIKEWPEKPWDWLESTNKNKRIVSVPYRQHILALGLLDEIRDAFSPHLVGSIERIPLTDSDIDLEDSSVNALLRRALLKAFIYGTDLATNGKNCIWEKTVLKKYEKREDCYIHRAIVLSLRSFLGKLHLIIKPTVLIFNTQGEEVSPEISKIIKNEFLGYQHNKEFNQALDDWRDKLFPTKGFINIEFPQNCGSTFRFRIRTAPLFAQIGSRFRKQIAIDTRIQPHIKQTGIEIMEPKLIFSNRQGTQYVQDSHPLHGLLKNRPFDYSLTSQGLITTIRLGVICPDPESQLLSQYLYQSSQIQIPNNTETDYLIDFPGFQQAFGLPLEIPRLGDRAWVTCSEPQNDGNTKQSTLQLANIITRSIDSITATEKPHVILVFIPDRWSVWREYQDDEEKFDLHDYIKAYCVQKGIATQFLEQDTIKHSQQCRIWWWLSLALYAKSMRTPWVLHDLDPDTAFVGLGFTINHFAVKGQHVVLGCSHVYNSQGEGLQFRLSKIENPIMVRHHPHMSYDDARRVAETIRQLFFESKLCLPKRVVVHKQTRFLDTEKNGLLDGLSGVNNVDLIEITVDSSLRYVSSVTKEILSQGQKKVIFDEDNYPVRRGTIVKIDNQTALVWCHGATDSIKPGWRYFQGKRHIPAPLLIRKYAGNSQLESLAKEILGLSKMDWNSADLYSKLPATIYSSRQIARIGAKLQRFGPLSYDYRLFM